MMPSYLPLPRGRTAFHHKQELSPCAEVKPTATLLPTALTVHSAEEAVKEE